MRLVNRQRGSRGGEYRADLEHDGKIIGHVERGLSTGYHGSRYTARIDGRIAATGRTLADVLDQLLTDQWGNDV